MISEKINHSYTIGDLEVKRLGYGSMQLTGKGVWGEPEDRQNAVDVLRKAVELGVNFIDTADSYGPFVNEEIVAEALHPYKSGLVIATKAGLTRSGPDEWKPNGHPDHLRERIEGSLKRLKMKQIPLWQLHRIDENMPVQESLKPVQEAVKAGKIKHVGLSEVSVDEIRQVEEILPVVSVQNKYNLADRKWEDVVDYTASKGMAFIPWYPLASGPDKLEDKMESIAEKYDATPAQIALAWLLKRSENIILIPGTKSINHLEENLQAGDIHLTNDDFNLMSK